MCSSDLKSPAMWGSHTHLEALFGSKVSIAAEKKHFNFRYKSPEHWLKIFRTYYGPVLKTFQAVDPTERASFERDIHALLDELNVAKDGTLVVPSEYLEVVITKKR